MAVSPLRGLTRKIRSFTQTPEPHNIGVEWEITKQVRPLEKECNEIPKKQRSRTGFIPLILFLALVTLWNALNCLQILITDLSAWIELSQPIVPECGKTIEDAMKINSTYCATFVKRMSDPIAYFLKNQTNLAEMYRPRYECTQTISICNDSVDDSDCNLWNAEELQIKPDPLRLDKDACVNDIEIAFLVVTVILALSGLLLAYRWKSTLEVLGIETKVYNLRTLTRCIAPGRKASQKSVSKNEEYNMKKNIVCTAVSDITVKTGKSEDKVSEDGSVITIGSNKEEYDINQTSAYAEAPSDIKSRVVLIRPQQGFETKAFRVAIYNFSLGVSVAVSQKHWKSPFPIFVNIEQKST